MRLAIGLPTAPAGAATLIDPAICTQPWVTKTTSGLDPLAETGEYFCIGSDEGTFRQKMRESAGGVGR